MARRGPLCATLLLLLLLRAAALADCAPSPPGGPCQGWLSGREFSKGTPRCQMRLDGKDAPSCCGTCEALRCCAAEEQPLALAHCLPHDPPKAAPRPLPAPSHETKKDDSARFIVLGMCLIFSLAAFLVFLLCFCFWLRRAPPSCRLETGDLYKTGLILLAAAIVLAVVVTSAFICRFCYWLKDHLLDRYRETQQRQTRLEGSNPSFRLHAIIAPSGYGASEHTATNAAHLPSASRPPLV